jgi:Uma2 family endonuclease
MTIAKPHTRPEIDYPETDGKPMAESDFQRPYVAYSTEVLAIHFHGRPDVYVSGNLLIYYEEGNSKTSISPDTFVVMGRPNRKRTSYFTWKENNKYPDFVLEITSKSTRKDDQTTKRDLYQTWGVQEYFQYDPTQDYLTPALQGLQLVNGIYQPLAQIHTSSGLLNLPSRVLDLNLQLESSGELRFYTPAGDRLLSHAEAVAKNDRLTTATSLLTTENSNLTIEKDLLVAENNNLAAEKDRLAAKLRELGIDPDRL